MVNTYGRSLLRFWWVLLIGFAVAQLTTIAVVYRIDFSTMPPTLTERTQPSYSASARLLVTSGESPFLRTRVTRIAEEPVAGGDTDPDTPGVQEAPANSNAAIFVTEAPETATLIQAANLFPLLIESDQVATVRDRLYGPLPGTIKAQAIFAVNTPSRFEPSRVPVIQLIAVADSPRQAIDLVTATTEAFGRWVTGEQRAAKLKPEERILIQPIQTPKSAAEFGG
ncbi:MAG: hypothetical protein ACRDN6_09995, partial [Gaiellaceae bacterium]